jgi:RNA polymerase primary sigma factor
VKKRQSINADMPAHLARLCESQLLSAAEERELFRRMNYLKFRANTLRATIDPEKVDVEKLELAEGLLAEATEIRNQIVQANTRLVMSIVKKFVTPQYSFDDMLSEGIETLLGAVEKFDYDRGFRFSTYAYRSVARSAYRTIKNRQKDQSRFTTSGDEVLDVSDEGNAGLFNEHTWESFRGVIGKLLGQLDRREQFIIRGRYTLGDEQKKRTFQSLANELGVSKERARQLEQRAMKKLRSMATELRLDELFEPAVA